MTFRRLVILLNSYVNYAMCMVRTILESIRAYRLWQSIFKDALIVIIINACFNVTEINK